jgi:hypothetical protein
MVENKYMLYNIYWQRLEGQGQTIIYVIYAKYLCSHTRLILKIGGGKGVCRSLACLTHVCIGIAFSPYIVAVV